MYGNQGNRKSEGKLEERKKIKMKENEKRGRKGDYE